MKHILITCLLLAAINKANAQGPMHHAKWEENSHSHTKTYAQDANEFTETEISMEGRTVTFSGLPEKRKVATAIVTDANGGVVLQKSISPQNNYLDLRRLSKGEMYFITIMYKQKSRKGFVVHL